MRDPFNFRNFTQKWCEITGTPLDDMPPKMLSELTSILPMPGQDEATLFAKIFLELSAGVDGKPISSDFLE